MSNRICSVSGVEIDESVHMAAGTRVSYLKNGRMSPRLGATVLDDVLGWHSFARVQIDGSDTPSLVYRSELTAV